MEPNPRIKSGTLVRIISGDYEYMIGVFSGYDPDDPNYCSIVINDLILRESVDNITTDEYFLKPGDPVVISGGDYIGKKGTIVSYDPDTFKVAINLNDTLIIHKPRDFVKYDSHDNDKEVPVICICGSMSLYKEMIKFAERKTAEGCLVLLPFSFGTPSELFIGLLSPEEEELCGKVHRKRIAMSDEIYVILLDGTIGENTQKNINYAKVLGKPVSYVDVDSYEQVD